MHYTKHSITSFIYHADLLVKNSMEVDDIRNAINKYGYGKSEIDRGNHLISELRSATMRQHMAKSEKVKNYKRKQELQMQVHKAYMKYVKIARIAFSDDVKARKALLLGGARGRVYNMWFAQVKTFCSIMLENGDEYPAVMARYGIGKEEIVRLNEQLGELNKLTDLCLKSVGEVRKLTDRRQKMVIETQHYLSDFLKIARIALEYSPQLLESLGVSVKS